MHSYVEGQDILAMQAAAPAILARLTQDVPDHLLSRKPAPGKWSVRAILAHMAEDELVSTWRYRQMIGQPGVSLAAFDQDQWARLGTYELLPAAGRLPCETLLAMAAHDVNHILQVRRGLGLPSDTDRPWYEAVME